MTDVRADVYLMDPIVVLSHTTDEWDITSQLSGFGFFPTATSLERTTFGNTHRRKGRGLKAGQIRFDLYVAFDFQGIFEMFAELWARESEYVGFTAYSDVGETYGVTGSFVLDKIPVFDGKIDEYNTTSLTFDTDGVITLVGDQT
jgi:hypothetical protein